MNIVHIVPTYFPFQSGGSAYSLYRLNCGLKKINKIVISEGLNRPTKKSHYTLSKNHKVIFNSKFSRSS